MIKNIILILVSLIAISCNPQSNNIQQDVSKVDDNQDYVYLNQPYKGYIKTTTFLERANGKEADFHKPNNDFSYSATGLASWYGHNDGFHGKMTANGDRYNKNSLTAAHRTLPMPSMARVTNLENGYSVILMINDRGPVLKDRLIDISERAAELLDFKHQGLGKVKVEYLPKQTEELLYKLGLKEKTLSKKDLLQDRCNAQDKCNIDYYVQIGAFKNRGNANKLAVKLQQFGAINITKELKDNLFKVVLGPYNIKSDASKVMETIKLKYDQASVIYESIN